MRSAKNQIFIGEEYTYPKRGADDGFESNNAEDYHLP